MPIAEGIAATKGAFEVGKIALDLLRHPSIDVAAVQGRLLELQGLILSAQSALGDAEDENRKLRASIEQLSEKLETAASITPAKNAYWTRHKNGKLDGPFCTVCWDDGRKLVRMHHIQDRNSTAGPLRVYTCHLHDTVSIKLLEELSDETDTIS